MLTILFIILHRFWRFVFDNGLIPPLKERYASRKTRQEQEYFLSNFTANVHHFVIYYAAYWAYQNPYLCEDPQPWQFFYDDVCFLTVHKHYF